MMPLRKATTLENELALAARFDYGILLVLPDVTYIGETGVAVGPVGDHLNVLFSGEQAGRMLGRLKEFHAEAVDR